MRRCLVAALSFCLCAQWLAGCRLSSGPQSLAELIPAEALVVLSLNWQAVRGDADLLALVRGAEFRKVFAEVNVEEEAVADIAVFGDGGEGAGGSTAMLLSGSFDGREVAESIKGRGWRAESYNEHAVYVSPADGTHLAALDSGALVCGTKKGVEGVIRVESGEGASLTSTDAYERLSPLFDTAGRPISMMIAFPQHVQDAAHAALELSSVVMDFAGVGPIGQLMSKIGYSRAIGCTIGREGESFPVEFVAVMKDEDAAALVSGGLNLLKGIGALAGQPPARTPEEAEALRSFQSMSITREGDVLSIGLVMSKRNLPPH
jgi:hypothetical protein